MEWIWFALFLMIFIIMVLASQIKLLKEDKFFLREDNISLRNDLKRTLFALETFYENKTPQKGRNDEIGQPKKKNIKKSTNNKNRVYIFEDAKSDKEAEKLLSFRNFLKKHAVKRIIMVCFENLLPKLLDDDDDSVVEEIFILDDNPNNLPIIFYGGDYDDFLDFLYFCCWEDRSDIEWIEDPWNIDNLKEVLKEISRR